MCCEPPFGPGNQFKNLVVAARAPEFGLAFFLLYPRYCIAAVAAYGKMRPVLFPSCKRMDNGKELADVVCPVLERPGLEDWCAVGHPNTAVFHFPGIAEA